MSVYKSLLQIKKQLGSLDHCLDKGLAYAAAKKFEPSVLLQSRLAPDMFPLVRQVQFTCDQAKYIAARGANKDVPAHEDKETTFEELKARIGHVIAYLDGFKESDFAGIETRTLSLPRWEGKSMTTLDYVTEHAIPNFYFHLMTTYLILRHNGVDVGKRDYLGALTYTA